MTSAGAINEVLAQAAFWEWHLQHSSWPGAGAMVTTRLQEHQQQLQQHTPQTHPNHVEAAAVSTPHGAAQASAAAQDPASGADATPTANGAAAPQPSKRAPLKSALKSRRPSQGDEEYREPAEDAAGFGATPGGGLLKKQVAGDWLWLYRLWLWLCWL